MNRTNTQHKQYVTIILAWNDRCHLDGILVVQTYRRAIRHAEEAFLAGGLDCQL